MQKLSKTSFISSIGKLLALLLAAKVIAVVFWWYLPNEGVELESKTSYQPRYQRVSFANMLSTQKEQTQQLEGVKSNTLSMSNFLLKGVYGSRYSGYAIIAKKSSPNDTEIVGVDEIYEGYILKEIALNEVIFSKNNKEYTLRLQEITPSNYVTPVFEAAQEGVKEVTRSDIATYSKDPSLIWKDIGIEEMKEGNKLIGFKVTRVKRGSKMETLGLQKDDLIIKANNIELTSIAEVLKLYKDIDKMETLALTILRNNQEQEIVYEIR